MKRIKYFFGAVCVLLSFVCISFSPLYASAVSPIDWAQMANDFKENIEQQIKEIEGAFITDIKNGNMNQTSDLAKKKAKIIALQMLYKMAPNMQIFWESAETVLEGLPGTEVEPLEGVSVYGSALSGMYQNQDDLSYHVVTVNTFNSNGMTPIVLAQSDEYTVSFTASQPDYIRASEGIFVNGRYRFWCDRKTGLYDAYADFISSANSSTFHSSSRNVPASNSGGILYFDFNSSSIPQYNTVRLNGNSGDYWAIGGNMQEVTLPNGTFDYDTPWNYYNNVLLPYIQQTFNDIDNIDNYLLFPDGYYPEEPQDPTETPTMPNGGINLNNTNINIEINIYYPTDESGNPVTETVTDESGEPVTDESGEPVTETVTETVYVTDTSPTDAVYSFTLPTLPHLEEYAETLPALDLAQFESGITFIMTATNGIFTDTGFLPVIIVTLSLSVLCYVVWKLGG